MTDRAQPGAQRSTARNIEYGEITGQHSDGWVVPSDTPTKSSQRYAHLDETQYDEFDAVSSPSSLEVTINPGEAFVDGWLATDGESTVTLSPNTQGQKVAIGWDPDAIFDEEFHDTRDEADSVIVDLDGNVSDVTPHFVAWEFDTDANGVTGVVDHRSIGAPTFDDTIDAATFDGLEQTLDTHDHSGGSIQPDSVHAQKESKIPSYGTRADIPTDDTGLFYVESEGVIIQITDTDNVDVLTSTLLGEANGVAPLDADGEVVFNLLAGFDNIDGDVVDRADPITNLVGNVYIRQYGDPDPSQSDGDIVITLPEA